MKIFDPPKNGSILWTILRQQLITTSSTVITLAIFILAGSFVIAKLTPWQETVEKFLGISFYSLPFFVILALIVFIGLVFSLIYSLVIGYPLGRELKRNLQEINEGAEALSRGRLDYRIKLSGYNEIIMIGQQFNQMATRTEKQVKSLQQLIDENVRLVNQTKLTTALDERRNLARELHDAVSQQLFAVSMILAALPRLMDKDIAGAKKSFQQVEAMVAHAQQELRALIMHLRPVTLEGVTLKEGIEQLFKELPEKHPNINWALDITDEIRISEGIEDQLFRVIQEAISNMLRHAKASSFRIRFTKRQERIILLMEDNGIGFEMSEKKKSSYGIETMKERIEGIGGRLDIISYPEKGTRVEIRVPIKSTN